MMQKLRFLFKLAFCRELGFNPEKTSDLFRRDALYQLVCGMETAEEYRRQRSDQSP